jgi:quinoprotein glucose dehydrogenase
MSVDEARGLVFVPNGAATFDFYGGDRVGKNLFSDSLVALRADTGKLAWYYQMVHHDLWDYDLPCPPNLVTLRQNGKLLDAVVQPVKNGLIFVLNRDTGKPIFPVEERSVPRSTLAGEQAWPTQPFPLKPPPLARLDVSESDLTDLSPEAHAFAVRKFREAAYSRIYSPPTKQGNIVTPGFHGGANWSGASYNPHTGRLVTNTNDVPYFLQMTDSKWWQRYKFGFQGFHKFLDPEGYPAVKPPWGKLTEIDLNTGTIAWQIPLGEYPELTARGIPLTGTENAGGSIITAGGLIFIGATPDRKFRAFDVDTGRMLWEATLDSAAHAAPSTYTAKRKQYVVIAAAGGSMVESSQGDEYVAFALPD